MTGNAIICGGSIAGLFAAINLMQAGWQVHVYERTNVPLAGRGAGIVTHPELIAALEAVGARTDDLGVDVYERVAYDIDGKRIAAIDFHQILTSWDRMFQVLRALVPDARYSLGRTLREFRETADGVTCVFEDGHRAEGDLLIGADGFRSAVRASMLPDVVPRYSGYLVWRALAHEADLPAEVLADIFKTFGFFIPSHAEVIGYPIAGTDNDLRPGHRRYNFVWYRCVEEAELNEMLTDATGRQHDMSIAPPLIRDAVIDEMTRDAATQMPAAFNAILSASERPFFTPIFDHHAPTMGRGRVVLAGDAACVARPHVGMGVTKAAQDAMALARLVTALPLDEAVAAYSDERVEAARIAYDAAQHLGSHILSDGGAFQTDGRSHPYQDAILRETAVMPTAASAAGVSA